MGATNTTVLASSDNKVRAQPGTIFTWYIPIKADKSNPFWFETGDRIELANRAIFLGCLDTTKKRWLMSFDYTINADSIEASITIGNVKVRVYANDKSVRWSEVVLPPSSPYPSVIVTSLKGPGWFGSKYDFTINVAFGSQESTRLGLSFSGSSDGSSGELRPFLYLKYADDKSLQPPSSQQLKGLLGNSCQRIRVFCSTEALYGENLTRSVLQVEDDTGARSYLRRPSLTSVMRGEGCTFSAKVYYWNIRVNGGTKDLTNGILTWGMIRYFLWYLTTSKWCVRVIESHYDRKFNNVVSEGPYACWLPYLDQYKSYARYYK